MEPVFMALAESASIAASLAIDANTTMQDLPPKSLRAALDRANQVTAL
jgi:hypothetical protein